MTRPPRVSLIIAVYQRPDLLEKVLESLVNQSFADFEILIADDGSGQEIRDVIGRYSDRFGHPIRHVWHEDSGFRKTIIVNRAVTEASTDYLVFIDGDCILHRRFVERHFKRRKKERVLSGRRVMFDRNLTERVTLDDVRTRRVEHVSYWWKHAGKIDRWRGFYLPAVFGVRNLFRNDYQILGSNFSVHKEDFYRVNGYDERIVGRGLEDNNLCTRFINSSMTIRTITHEAIQYHCFHRVKEIPHSEEFIEQFRESVEPRTPYGIVKES